jgi:hypothetical protein
MGCVSLRRTDPMVYLVKGKCQIPDSHRLMILTCQRFHVYHIDSDGRYPQNGEENWEAYGKSPVLLPDCPCSHCEYN